MISLVGILSIAHLGSDAHIRLVDPRIQMARKYRCIQDTVRLYIAVIFILYVAGEKSNQIEHRDKYEYVELQSLSISSSS